MEQGREVIGVLLAQIGTPNMPETAEVRKYLKRFLSDRRVIDYHPMLWQPLLRGVILRVRPRRSARLYQEIWTADGSPLRVIARRQQERLQELLGARFVVEAGLSYSEPGLGEALSRLEQAGADKIVILPLYPQYSSTTTASIYDQAALAALGQKRTKTNQPYAAKRFIPSLRFTGAFYNHPGYITALTRHLQTELAVLKHRPDRFLLSFHGIPQRYVDTGDPYVEQCRETARLLALSMGWHEGEWQVAFQSRFGREVWAGPDTLTVIGDLAGQGVKRPFIFAPGFASDCLETLHELAIEGRRIYTAGGGSEEHYVVAPCLNDSPHWMEFLSEYVQNQAQGW